MPVCVWACAGVRSQPGTTALSQDLLHIRQVLGTGNTTKLSSTVHRNGPDLGNALGSKPALPGLKVCRGYMRFIQLLVKAPASPTSLLIMAKVDLPSQTRKPAKPKTTSSQIPKRKTLPNTKPPGFYGISSRLNTEGGPRC